MEDAQNIDRLPPRVKEKLFDKNILDKAKSIEAFEVFEKFKSRKMKQSSVPGDIPPKLKKEFYVELASPVAEIFNSITRSGVYPRQWVREFTTPITRTFYWTGWSHTSKTSWIQLRWVDGKVAPSSTTSSLSLTSSWKELIPRILFPGLL